MFNFFRRSAPREDAPPRLVDVGEARRVYAIGDIHGRADLFRELLSAIVEDHEKRSPCEDLRLVLLGDLIDRGPDSAEVVDMAMALADQWHGFTCLKGNHEEIFVEAFLGHDYALRFFRGMGRDTMLSYGITPEEIDAPDDAVLHEAILTHVPEAHRDFIRELPSTEVIGDYLFVHAGIKPGVALAEQQGDDLLWIREEFLNSAAAHPHMVVHGHSISEFVDEQANRIGIDTGAYASDRLTAIGLEGTERWFLST